MLVFYYVCPAETSDLMTRPETISPVIGASTPVQVVGQCVEGTHPENGVQPGLTCSTRGIWSVNFGAGCVCGSGFQLSADGRSCVGTLSVCLLFQALFYISLPSAVCDAGLYETGGTCLPCPANSNSTQSAWFVCVSLL